MVKKVDKKKTKPKTKPKTIKQTQNQKQITIVNVFYDKGKRRVRYKKSSPKVKPPRPIFEAPRFIIPEVRYIANYSNNDKTQQNQITDLIKIISSNNFVTQRENQIKINNAFLDQLEKKQQPQQPEEQEKPEEPEQEQELTEEEPEREKNIDDDDSERKDAMENEDDKNYQVVLNYYKKLSKYVKAEGNADYETIDGRLGRLPKANEIKYSIDKLKNMYGENAIQWSLKDNFISPPNEPEELQYF